MTALVIICLGGCFLLVAGSKVVAAAVRSRCSASVHMSSVTITTSLFRVFGVIELLLNCAANASN